MLQISSNESKHSQYREVSYLVISLLRKASLTHENNEELVLIHIVRA